MILMRLGVILQDSFRRASVVVRRVTFRVTQMSESCWREKVLVVDIVVGVGAGLLKGGCCDDCFGGLVKGMLLMKRDFDEVESLRKLEIYINSLLLDFKSDGKSDRKSPSLEQKIFTNST
jgi:hypothetical protein